MFVKNFLHQGKIFVYGNFPWSGKNICSTKNFPWTRKFSRNREFSTKMIQDIFYKKFSFIKETFHKQRLSLIKVVFHKQRFICNQENCPKFFYDQESILKLKTFLAVKKKFLKQRSKKFLKKQDFRSIQ